MPRWDRWAPDPDKIFFTDVGIWALSLIILFLEHLFYNFILHTDFIPILVYFQGKLKGYTSYKNKDVDAALEATEVHEC